MIKSPGQPPEKTVSILLLIEVILNSKALKNHLKFIFTFYLLIHINIYNTIRITIVVTDNKMGIKHKFNLLSTLK